MALNIKNERTVALIRELADATGQNMTSAIEEAIVARLDQVRADPHGAQTDAAKRLAEIRRLVAEIDASLTDADRERLRTAEDDLYDEFGLPA